MTPAVDPALVQAFIDRAVLWVGGLSGVLFLSGLSQFYHNWVIRRELRGIRAELRDVSRSGAGTTDSKKEGES